MWLFRIQFFVWLFTCQYFVSFFRLCFHCLKPRSYPRWLDKIIYLFFRLLFHGYACAQNFRTLNLYPLGFPIFFYKLFSRISPQERHLTFTISFAIFRLLFSCCFFTTYSQVLARGTWQMDQYSIGKPNIL